MYQCVQNSSSNGGHDAALEDPLDGGLNVGFEWAPYQLKMHKRVQLTFYLTTFTLNYEHASAI